MVINNNIKQKKRRGKCHSPALLHGKITTDTGLGDQGIEQ
jgi:hypothetical protein